MTVVVLDLCRGRFSTNTSCEIRVHYQRLRIPFLPSRGPLPAAPWTTACAGPFPPWAAELSKMRLPYRRPSLAGWRQRYFLADAFGFQDDVHEIQCCEKKKTIGGRAGELFGEQADKLAGDW